MVIKFIHYYLYLYRFSAASGILMILKIKQPSLSKLFQNFRIYFVCILISIAFIGLRTTVTSNCDDCKTTVVYLDVNVSFFH